MQWRVPSRPGLRPVHAELMSGSTDPRFRTYAYLITYVLGDKVPPLVTQKERATMAKRHSIPRHQAQRQFTRTAQKVHPKNTPRLPMRGGIRL